MELYHDSGVIQTSISDHYMIYAVRKARPMKAKHKTINFRSFKILMNKVCSMICQKCHGVTLLILEMLMML